MQFLETTTEAGSSLYSILMLVMLVLVFWLMIVRPQKKQEKEAKQMRDSTEIGDEVVTIGGIIGIVASMKDDTLVIETGSDRAKVRVARWAIQSNLTVHENESEVKEKKSKNSK